MEGIFNAILEDAYASSTDVIKHLKTGKVLLFSSLFLFLSVIQALLCFWLLQNIYPLPIFLSWMQIWHGLLAAWCLGELGELKESLKFFPVPSLNIQLLQQLFPAGIFYSFSILFTILTLQHLPCLSLFPLSLCLPCILSQLLDAIRPGSGNNIISCFGAGFAIVAFLIHIFDFAAFLPWILLYTFFAFTYRSFYLPKASHIVEKQLFQLHIHFHFIGSIVILPIVFFSKEITVLVDVLSKQNMLAFGCFVTPAVLPFAKSVVANYLLQHCGPYLWRMLEIVSILIIGIVGYPYGNGLVLIHAISTILLVFGRSFDLCYLMHRDKAKQLCLDAVFPPSANPHFLAQFAQSTTLLQKPLLSKSQSISHTIENELTKEALRKIVKGYATRSTFEDLELLNNMGGIDELYKILLTNPKTGFSSDPDDIEERKQQFGENRLPHKSRTAFLTLCFDAANDFTLRILMLCGAISTVINILFSSHPELEWIEGFAIWMAVIIVVLVTAGNDYIKEQQFEKLTAVKEDKLCSVIRNGLHHEIGVHDLVVGDILSIETGDELPADCLVLHSSGVTIDESSLTGETDSISKNNFYECWNKANLLLDNVPKMIAHHDIDSPVVLSGTTVSSGSATCLVICVGKSSQIGQMYQKLAFDAEPTPLQKKLNSIATDIGNLGFICACLTLAVLLLEFWIVYILQDKAERPRSLDIVEEHVYFFITTVTIIVVAVPEGLPLAVTISLAYSIGQMLLDKNYVRRLAACEIMGGANEICSDKTGTLTTNKMTVQAFWNGSSTSGSSETILEAVRSLPSDYINILAQSVALNSTGYLDEQTVKVEQPVESTVTTTKYVGSPTECALLQFINELGENYNDIRKKYGGEEHIASRNEFNSSTKLMSTVISLNGEADYAYRLYVKGAAEIVLRTCSKRYDASGKIVMFEEDEALRIEETVITAFAADGLRTICLAYKDLDAAAFQDFCNESNLSKSIRKLICIGIAGIRDPVRREVPQSVLGCQLAGIRVRMITGDNIITAKRIATECHILDEKNGGIAMTGSEFYNAVGGVVCKLHLTEVCKCALDERSARRLKTTVREDTLGDMKEFARIAESLQVIARSQPNDKYALVTGLKQQGAVVAVTGDGTNDAPALKKADIGFAMGIAGKEIAKHAADIVLLDDNFFSIVQAVKWGRSIYDNIRRFLQFQLTVNVVAVLLSFTFSVVGRQSPLDAVQTLWVNLIMDSFASLALATEKPTDSLLNRKPHSRNDYLITKVMMRSILMQAAYQILILNLIIFYGEYFIPETKWNYLAEEVRVANNFCEFSDCNPETGRGTLIRSGRHFIPFSRSKDYLREWDTEIGPSRHFTIVFNTFVLMQLFNMINARKVEGESNVFKNFLQNEMWLAIWILLIISQVLMVQYGGFFVKCHLEGLTPTQWLISIIFGAGSILVGFTTQFFPLTLLPELGIKEVDPLVLPESFAMQARGRTPERLAGRLQVIRSFIAAKKYARRARLKTISRMATRSKIDFEVEEPSEAQV